MGRYPHHSNIFMEYQVSARKYRPMSFSSVVGQEALTTTLKNAIASGKLAHAFLFCGSRGVGKTTCARIFAKTINCEHPTAEGEACGECESCKAFAEGRSYNIFELDAASNNSVENIKQLMEQTRIPPQIGRYKVFIIDEVHMLSTQAFNAFLKTLEEPPSYVIFILATTEKNKLLPTILSRCQIYDFDRMTVSNTVNHLKMVAEREGYTYEEEALEMIAEKADGGMRDALSIFDQAASFCQGNITLEKVIRDLNLMDVEFYFQMVDMALSNKCADLMLLLNDMIAKGMDGGNIVSGLAAHIRNVLMAKDPQTITLLEASKRYSERYAEQARKCPAPFLYKALQILTRCDLNYQQSSSKRLLVEVTLIEVAQITQPDDDSAPRKGHRLKSLFKKLTPIQPQPVKQVTGAVNHDMTSGTSASDTATQRTSDVMVGSAVAEKSEKKHEGLLVTGGASVEKPKIAKPVMGNIKIPSSAFGSSFGAIQNKEKKQEEDTGNITTGESKQFTEDDLLLEWRSMCNRMQENINMRGLASSMRNLKPHITSYPEIEVVVTNNILLEQMKNILRRIKATLIAKLHNDNIQLTFRIAESTEIERVLTKHELYQKMLKDAPQLEKLIKALKLELI